MNDRQYPSQVRLQGGARETKETNPIGDVTGTIGAGDGNH